jgi:hypothetical protein
VASTTMNMDIDIVIKAVPQSDSTMEKVKSVDFEQEKYPLPS